MVAPNRVLGNIQFPPSAFTSTASQIDYLLAGLAIDINTTKKVNNYDNARERSSSSSFVSSRSTSVESKASSIPYYKRIVIQNDLLDEEFKEPIDCSQLPYNNNCQGNSYVNIVVNLIIPQGP